MNSVRSARHVQHASWASLALVVVALLAVVAACGSGVESPNSSASSEALLGSGSQTQYSFEWINFPGSMRTLVWGINDLGVAVGSFADGNGIVHGFIRKGHSVQIFDFPGSSSTSFLDISDTGTAVGWFNDASGKQHGFTLAPDMTSTVIDFPGAANTYVGSINNRGDMVGSYGPTIDEGVGFLLRNGRFTTLGDPPNAAPSTNLPLGINDVGVISGFFTDGAGAEHGFVLREGTYTILDPLGGADTEVTKINDLGNAVGHSGPVPFNGAEGFIVNAQSGRSATFSCPGGFAIRARGINNRGQVTGGCRTGPAPAPYQGFIATPIDE